MRRSNGWLVMLVFLILVWSTSAWALTTVKRSFDELVMLAEVVLIGTVTDVKSALDPEKDRIYTYVTLADCEVIKGEVLGQEYILRVKGGSVGNRAEVYAEMPQLEEGGRYLLFVRGNFRDIFPVVGIDQGVFKVEWDTDRQQEMVWPLHNEGSAGPSGEPLGSQQQERALPQEGVPVEQFVQRIHERLQALDQERLDTPRPSGPAAPPAQERGLP